MPTRFDNSSSDDITKFNPQGIEDLTFDPDPSRYGDVKLDLKFAEQLAREGQQQPGEHRKDSQNRAVGLSGRRRHFHIRYINRHPELWAEWGVEEPMVYLSKYRRKTPAEGAERAISENLERAELRPIDRAKIAQRYKDMSREDAWIADRLRVSTARIRQLLDLFSLGDDVLKLVDEGILTEAAARSLKMLSAEQIAEVVAGIRSGSKPHEVLAEIRAKHRESGRPRPRTTREVLKEVEGIGGTRAHLFTRWMKGEKGIDIRAILGEEAAA